MLSLLHIENIAVIEQADISFHGGFNVLTGETGAGKSIVIDAISAILGERTYRDVIRTGAQKAFVSAVFCQTPRLDWFEENHVEYDPELLIQREIYLDGRNVCRVNSMPVSVAVLRRLGMQLVNIHGQHDSQQLFEEQTHLLFLDSYAQNGTLRQTYAERFAEVQVLRQEIQRLSMDESEKARRMETLTYQIRELEQAQLKPGEDAALDERRKLLQNSEKLVAGLMEADAALYGDENTDGAGSLLTNAGVALSRIARFDPKLGSLYEKVKSLSYEVQDAADELREMKDGFAYSEEELEQIETRLDLLHRLKRKYGATCEEMLSFLTHAKAEFDEIEFAGDRVEQLKKKLSDAEKEAQEAGLLLRRSRQEASQRMETQILSELAQLDMPRVQFACDFSETELTEDGMDAVRFLMSANVGEALKPLSKVASGGELARIMLAMKNVLAEQDAVQTLIFDEVDAGVSGRAAQKVAEKLRSVAAHKQVLCVTHLPQIAAMADTHLLISKGERQGRTYTSVTLLDTEGRVNELARIIGGAVITDTTRKSAEEMLMPHQIKEAMA